MSKSHSDVAHEWAQGRGGCAEGYNMFYRGDTIYSYGYHFPIARIVSPGTILFTTRDYSVSTSKHKSIVRNAINYSDVHYITNVDAKSKDEHLKNMRLCFNEASEQMDLASRARSRKDDYRANASSILADLEWYAKQFLPRHKFKFNIDGLLEERASLQKKKDRKEAKERRNHAKRQAEDLKKWVDGGLIPPHFFASDVKLRLTKNKEEVETSHGARIPSADALKFFELCEKCKDRLRGMTSFTHKLGDMYVPDCIEGNGDAQVGCHKIKFEEMDRIAQILRG